MAQNEFRTATPTRKKVKKITLTAGIILGIICFLLGLMFGGAFSSNKELEKAQQQVAKLELDLKAQTGEFEKYKETSKKENEILKQENAKLKGEINNSKEAPVDNASEDNAPATPAKEDAQPTQKTSNGVFKTVVIAIIILAVIAIILFAVLIFLKKGNHDDEDEYEDDEYYDEEDEEYEEDDDEDEDEYDEDDEYEDDEE